MEFPPQHEASAAHTQSDVFNHNATAQESEPVHPLVPAVPTDTDAGLTAPHVADAAPLEPVEEAEPASEEAGAGPAPSAPQAPKRAPRPSLPPQKGTTVFPLARIAKIVKADSAVDICSKEATFLISAATELFVKKFVEEGCINARMDKRKMVRYDDMAKAAQQNEYLDFLRDVVPMPVPLSVAMQQRAQMAQAGEEQEALDASPTESSKPADAHEPESDADMDAEDAPSPSPLPPAPAKEEASHEWSPTPSAAMASSANLSPSESGGTPVLPTPQQEEIATPMDL
ncbi:DNA-directed DNA polymerase [Malassezia furfur]|uniref:DNA-directed DNA polymerase n=1 Tax=Malassezia furfur TaxID=55194 RepID=A0ABY8ENR7_MALFU|nr:DNA-directed DNA polymerase [Malassezia furfur]